MQDVAHAAGFSAITVSRVLRSPEKVSAETRKRVETAMSDLDYLPNLAAGTLRSHSSPIVAVVLPTITNSIYAETIHGMADALHEGNLQLLMGESGYSTKREEEIVRVSLGWRPAGIVLAGSCHSRKARSILMRSGVPVVEMWTLPKRPIDSAVGFSNYDAAKEMTEYLIGRGYCRIGYIGGLVDGNDRTTDRERGYRDALQSHGLTFDPSRMRRRTFDFGAGKEGLADLLNAHPDLDAVFLGADVLAVGALSECRARGIAVPRDLAIAGFDDAEIASVVEPPLTTVRTPRYALGRTVADLVMARLNGRKTAPEVIDLGFEIVRRNSA